MCRAGKETINPYGKFGVSGNAFIDYHQFGEATGRCCVHHLARGLVYSHDLAEIYLRQPSKADAPNVTDMHNRIHKMPAMLGSLDVMKVYRRTDPLHSRTVSRKGKYASIALEAVVDNNYGFDMHHSKFQEL